MKKRSGRNVEKGLWENREKKRKIIKNEKKWLTDGKIPDRIIKHSQEDRKNRISEG